MSTLGINAILAYTTGTMLARVNRLLSLIPNPDTNSNSGAVAGGANGVANTYLDEMSPAAAVQLRVEVAALAAGVAQIAAGQQTVLAADATANQTDIVTGLADLAIANAAVTVRRAGTNVTADAVLSEPVAGTIRVADGATYNTTAGDIITWAVVA